MTAEAFKQLFQSTDGIEFSRLEPLTALLVWTQNSLYRLIVAQGCDVLLQGGTFFPEPTPAHVEGASAGGSLLKRGWIGVGLLMEFRVGRKHYATSPVSAIATERVVSRVTSAS